MATATMQDQTSSFPLLRRTVLKRFLNEVQMKELEAYCRMSTRKPGSTLFRQGEPAEFFYILVDGTIELRARPPGRRVYRTIEFVQPSCTFGDETLFGEPQYLASARAMESSRVCAMSAEEFDRLVDVHPAIATGVLRCSGACLVATLRRSAILTQAPADVGLRLLLDELAESEGGGRAPRAIRITHAQLAGVLHVSRETVSRMLRQLVTEGEVELGRGVIRVRRT